MVRMHSASLCSEEKPVVTSADMSEESSLFGNSAYEFTLAIEDEDFAVGAKNKHESRKFRDDTLLDFLFNVDTLFEFKCALSHFPKLDA